MDYAVEPLKCGHPENVDILFDQDTLFCSNAIEIHSWNQDTSLIRTLLGPYFGVPLFLCACNLRLGPIPWNYLHHHSHLFVTWPPVACKGSLYICHMFMRMPGQRSFFPYNSAAVAPPKVSVISRWPSWLWSPREPVGVVRRGRARGRNWPLSSTNLPSTR